ncbi:MAG: T9SS type A sorting domain-containing protein [Ferruginibacter sp.]
MNPILPSFKIKKQPYRCTAFLIFFILAIPSLMRLSAQQGHIYIHNETSDESAAASFTYTINGAGAITLNDAAAQVNLKDIGASENGRLWAIGNFNNILYYRDAGSSKWIQTAVSNANRVDGAAANTAYVVTLTGEVLFMSGTAADTIGQPAAYGNSHAFDIGSAWDDRPYIINNAGAVWRYTGAENKWKQVIANSIKNYWIDGNPATGGFVLMKMDQTVYNVSSTGVETALGKPAAADITKRLDVAVDADGDIFGDFSIDGTGYVYKWNGVKGWIPELTSCKALRITAGVSEQVWGVFGGYGQTLAAPYGNIFSRSANGGSIKWIDDERVRLNPANGNAAMIAVSPGSYTVTQMPHADWSLTGITIQDPSSNSGSGIMSSSASLTVAAGETVHVIFKNSLLNPFAVVNNCNTVYTENFGKGVAGTYGGPLAGFTDYHWFDSALAKTGMAADDGYYSIAATANPGFAWSALSLNDHTTGNGTGRMMLVNAAGEKKEFFRRRFTGLIPGATYNFSAWIANISDDTVKPNICFKVIHPGNFNVLASKVTGDISSKANWNVYTLSFTAASSSVDLVLQNNAADGEGNDFALDDISLSMVKPVIPVTTIQQPGCISGKGSVTVTAPTGAFYEYSMDGKNYQAEPVFSSLDGGVYEVSVRFTGAAGCTVQKTDTLKTVVCNTAPAADASMVNQKTMLQDKNMFSAQSKDCNSILLSIKNVFSEDVDHIEVERSNGDKPFKTVAMIFYDKRMPACSFRDNNLGSGTQLYRLKLVYIDGSFFYSETAYVMPDCNRSIKMIYPNPAYKTVVVSGLTDGETVNIFSVTGQLLKTKSASASREVIDIDDLKDGIFTVAVYNDKHEKMMTAQILKAE